MKLTGPALETLLSSAIRAPSGDNLQPWRFIVSIEPATISLLIDEASDPSPMNSGQRASRMALGAALQNMLFAARCKGWHAELKEVRQPALALVELSSLEENDRLVDPAIADRVTNRREYDRRELSSAVVERLRTQVPPIPGVSAYWINDRARIVPLASLIGRADAAMFMEPSMRRAFLSNIRFDQPWNAEVVAGLSLASLEVSAAERAFLRAMPYVPHWLFKFGGASRIFASVGRRLAESASGFCLIVQDEMSPQADILAGRLMQQVWLALTADGFAVQPMMSLPVLENALQYGSAEVLDSLGRDKTRGLVDEFRAAFPEITGAYSAFLMRFGFAAPPTARTRRLPLDAVMVQDAGKGACSIGVGQRFWGSP